MLLRLHESFTCCIGESSSLKLIEKLALCRSGVCDSYADCVQELCEASFGDCTTLSWVTFGDSSSLKLIGKLAFYRSGV